MPPERQGEARAASQACARPFLARIHSARQKGTGQWAADRRQAWAMEWFWDVFGMIMGWLSDDYGMIFGMLME